MQLPSPSPDAPRRPLALLWPLLAVGVIALAAVIVGLGARYLLPVSATAHTLLYAANVFVIMPALLVGVPVLLIAQGVLLVRFWGHRPPRLNT